MTNFQPGDIVDVVIRSARIVAVHHDGWMRINTKTDTLCIDYPSSDVAVLPAVGNEVS